jgi:D-arabinono-1,4-lactone oxidase
MMRLSSSAEGALWRTLEKQVKRYGWMTLVGTLVSSVFLAHPRVLGRRRCVSRKSRRHIRAFHLIEAPLIGYLGAVGYYALRRVDRTKARRFSVLVDFSNLVKLAFFAFESASLIASFPHRTPKGERRDLTLGALLLLFGAGVGLRMRLALNDYFHPVLDARFVHPRTEEELIQLVKRARALGVQLRVRGSQHCVPQGISTDEGAQHINVQLDQYTGILGWKAVEGGKRMRVTVQAGCHLGVDPGNPFSNEENSLLAQLEARGWALPDLGGITHQTVGGFLSTGSMGGTTRHDLGRAIVGIRLIDGTGKVHDLAPNPEDPDDAEHNPFYAAGVSLGLLGIISTVTFECEPRYDVVGRQDTRKTAELEDPGLFESGAQGLQRFLETNEDAYARLLWWPQKGVDKVDVWRARREYTAESQTHRPALNRRPFVQVPRILQFVINAFYNFIAHDAPPYKPLIQRLVRLVLNAFLREGETKEFRGPWHEILPMDNGISDQLMPTDFTELFIPIERTGEVMKKLRDFFAEDTGDMALTGSYAFEIYAGHASAFWLSPSYGRHSIRVDVFWFRTDKGDREKFYARYWELLRPFGFRLHWGKFLPEGEARYLRQRYPKWDDFMALRQKMDPDGVFLSSYWKRHLGLESSGASRVRLARVAASVGADS